MKRALMIVCYILAGLGLLSLTAAKPEEIMPILIETIIFLVIAIKISIKKRKGEYKKYVNRGGEKNYSNTEKKEETSVSNNAVEYNANKENCYNLKPKKYQKKQFTTNCEKRYENIIKEAISEEYILRPQICLASIIDKVEKQTYVNELFRIIDFGVFDKEDNIILLIEINDSSHRLYHRRKRDEKVKEICAEAEIPLLTFWTEYCINEQYIERRINECLDELHVA